MDRPSSFNACFGTNNLTDSFFSKLSIVVGTQLRPVQWPSLFSSSSSKNVLHMCLAIMPECPRLGLYSRKILSSSVWKVCKVQLLKDICTKLKIIISYSLKNQESRFTLMAYCGNIFLCCFLIFKSFFNKQDSSHASTFETQKDGRKVHIAENVTLHYFFLFIIHSMCNE